ncbi:MAG: InlB B-repeat-containing protein, partial [Firmicutes bacterium]|nr:InlB B-repeat-containing protein [Bacillota bacterium]
MWRFRRRRGSLIGLLLLIIIIAAVFFFLHGCTPGSSSSSSSITNTSQTLQYSVHFDLNGYLAYDPPGAQTVTPGALATEPTTVKRPGYTLTSWSTDTAGTNPWDFVTDTVDASMTLCA